jgi:putative membrane protein
MNTPLTDPKKLKIAKIAIYSASIAIPLVVAILFGVKIKSVNLNFFLFSVTLVNSQVTLKIANLPQFYATINGITAFFLILALLAIKRKNQVAHRRYIRLSLLLSLVFLVCYVAYHMTSDPTHYGGEHPGLYYFLLISHIILSVVVVPIVLFTYLFAWQGNFEKHKKWTRFAWPIWFYVAVTGVVVYMMISPYYTHI